MVVSLWHIREDPDFNPNVDYGDESQFFTLMINHGGVFTKTPRRTYLNGKVTYVDFIDIDLFSIHELNAMIQEIGYVAKVPIWYHYRVPNYELDYGLRALGNDKDALKMMNYVHKHKMIEVYTEHLKTNLKTYLLSPDSKVIIEEIEEELPALNEKKSHLRREFDMDIDMDFDPFNGETKTEVDEQRSYVVFDPFNGEEETETETHVRANTTDNGNKKEDIHSDESDSEFIVDEDNNIDDVEVDMRHFKLSIDCDEEWVGQTENAADDDDEQEGNEDTGIDLEDFDTATESESEGPKKKALKKIRRQQKKANELAATKAKFYVGKIFPSKESIRKQVTLHAIETRRQLYFLKNDLLRVRIICKRSIPKFVESGQSSRPTDSTDCVVNKDTGGPSSQGKGTKIGGKYKKINVAHVNEICKESCPWVLHISKGEKDQTWMVKTYTDVHKCMQTRNVKKCTSSFLSKEIQETIVPNPEIPIKALQDQFQRKYKLGVSHMKVFRAKSMATEKVRGDFSLQYSLLRDYCLEVMRTNPDTTIKIDVEREFNPASETRQFKRIYVCLWPLKKCFKLCQRDLLGLDGCFMKGPYPGQILTAVRLDANNGIYPVAYAIVETENTNSWCWFLKCLGQDLGLSSNSNFTFISDRQKGIIPAIGKIFPCTEHIYCLRHIHENMKSQWKGSLFKDLLWKCATATTVPHFDKCMEDVRKVSKTAFEWLKQIPPMHWSRSHFTGRSHCDVLLNNMCEVLNKQLVKGRDQPIITCLEYIREYLMKRIVVVQKSIEKSDGPLTPNATKLFNQIKKDAAQYKVLWNGAHKYQVTGPWNDQVVMDVNEKTCTCRKWELTGMPCKHVVATIWDMGVNNMEVGVPEQWCHQLYWLETWRSVYAFKIDPINGSSMWPKSECPTTLIPPRHHTQVGRPKKKRRKTAEELSEKIVGNGKLGRLGKTVTCHKCKREGHNSRSCKGQESQSTRARDSHSSQARTTRSRAQGVRICEPGSQGEKAGASQKGEVSSSQTKGKGKAKVC